MKRYFFSIFYYLIAFQLLGLTLTLKEEVVTGTREITLQSVVEEKVDPSFGEIIIKELKKSKDMITSLEILDVLYKNEIRSVNLIGYGTVIMTEEYIKENRPEQKNTKNEGLKNSGPIAVLEEHFLSFLDSSLFKVGINPRSVSPQVSLDTIKDDYTWEFKKLSYGLKDMENIKELDLVHKGRRYRVKFDLHIYATIYLTGQNVQKGLLVDPGYFYKKDIDITAFRNIDSLVFDINKVQNTKVISSLGTGHILRWSDIEKIPALINGEKTDIKVVNSDFSIVLKGTVMQKGFLNEKVRVKLDNGNILHGIVKSQGEDFYVEVM